MDFLPQREALLNDENVFGLIVVAQLDAKQLKDPKQRFGAKTSLVRKLYQRGYNKEQVLQLFYYLNSGGHFLLFLFFVLSFDERFNLLFKLIYFSTNIVDIFVILPVMLSCVGFLFFSLIHGINDNPNKQV